jgi:tRNA A58 N-methylase Trm61
MSIVCPSWLSFILYNPVRKAFTDRRKIVTESGITKDSVVLEVGAGNGFLTEALAENAGKAYAVELQEGMIQKLTKRVQKFGNKVAIIRGDIASIVLEKEFVDVCLLYYCFHEVGNSIKAAENIAGAVKKGGILSIYEPSMEVGKQEMQKTAALFEQTGFTKETERDSFFTRFVRLRKRLY